MARSDQPVATIRARSIARSPRLLALNLLVSLRPHQWTKNLFVFAGLIFGERLLDPESVARSLAAFAIFCALSGAVYLVNDLIDREADRTNGHNEIHCWCRTIVEVR